MKNERFWFGVALCVLPLVIILSALGPPSDDGRSGWVEGHVSIHGHPMAGGYIVFVPDDLRLRSAVGWLDDQGHYVIGPGWRRKGEKVESRFRICLIPKSRRSSWGVSHGPDWAGASGGGTNPAGPDASAAMNVASGGLQRLSDPRTSDLEVRLDSGPAQIDIAL
jgi:hypothetical protein